MTPSRDFFRKFKSIFIGNLDALITIYNLFKVINKTVPPVYFLTGTLLKDMEKNVSYGGVFIFKKNKCPIRQSFKISKENIYIMDYRWIDLLKINNLYRKNV